LNLTTSRTLETGIKQLFWDSRAEWTLSIYDIERKNVYAAQGGQQLNIAGRQLSKGVELDAAVRPVKELTVWGNIAYVNAEYADYVFAGGSFSGNTPPNAERCLQCRRIVPLPDAMAVAGPKSAHRSVMSAIASIPTRTRSSSWLTRSRTPMFVDIDRTRVAFRVRNLTDEKYVAWGDPFYPDQVAGRARWLRSLGLVQILMVAPFPHDRALIVVHRWLGVAFCLLFAMWFATGIVMHFVPFPALTETGASMGSHRLRYAVKYDPAEAVAASKLTNVTRVRLWERTDGPAYVVSGDHPVQ
jgi:hypothetical protein